MQKRNEYTDRLVKLIKDLDNEEDIYEFFEDLCTIKEFQDMALRLDTALHLKEGMNYENISKVNGMSAATISKVSKCLNYSEGYQKAIAIMNKQRS